nr:hypothetical protein OG461_26415 [Streptomyces sp. NBC_00995]
MTDRAGYDENECREATRRAEHATKSAWAAIAGTAGALGCALIVLGLLVVGAVLAALYVVVSMDH